jgi:hypothetical protein
VIQIAEKFKEFTVISMSMRMIGSRSHFTKFVSLEPDFKPPKESTNKNTEDPSFY